MRCSSQFKSPAAKKGSKSGEQPVSESASSKTKTTMTKTPTAPKINAHSTRNQGGAKSPAPTSMHSSDKDRDAGSDGREESDSHSHTCYASQLKSPCKQNTQSEIPNGATQAEVDGDTGSSQDGATLAEEDGDARSTQDGATRAEADGDAVSLQDACPAPDPLEGFDDLWGFPSEKKQDTPAGGGALAADDCERGDDDNASPRCGHAHEIPTGATQAQEDGDVGSSQSACPVQNPLAGFENYNPHESSTFALMEAEMMHMYDNHQHDEDCSLFKSATSHLVLSSIAQGNNPRIDPAELVVSMWRAAFPHNMMSPSIVNIFFEIMCVETVSQHASKR
jgi:hypothetical protein